MKFASEITPPRIGAKGPLVFVVLAFVSAQASAAPQFNRDIRPILSENCFYCHGQDPKHREAKRRLDVREDALRERDGSAPIVPGKPDQSEMIRRLLTHDPDDQMPPPKSNRKVSAAQIETIKQWIASGAAYEKHWAFTTPVRPPLPEVRATKWPKNEIDRFVLAKLGSEGLQPSREASPEKWLRRVSFDLIGLPAAPKEIDAFKSDVAARGEAAYASAVDRLLASEHFGERQAIDWLDVARYADTHGFNNDSARTMWRWRDWVIDAFNSNKPYDQFITEQLAGDLLPNATVEQRIATGFCRNHVINSEGGIIDEEYRVEYVADRVRTLSMAWMGLTMECSRCHDHKFDPITQKDYYRLFAFFNNVAEFGEDGRVANAVPLMPAPTKEQARELAEKDRAIAELDRQLNTLRSQAPAREIAAEPAPKASFILDAESIEVKAKGWSFPAKPPTLEPGVVGNAWFGRGDGPMAKLDPAAFPLSGGAGSSVSFWIKPSSDVAADAPILSNLNHHGNPADAGFGRGVEIRLVNGEIEFRASDRWPAYALCVRSEHAAIDHDNWRHVALTFTPPAAATARIPTSTVRMFVDGEEVATTAVSDGLGIVPGPQPWLLGADNSKDGEKFKGAIDQWRAFSKALSSKEVRGVFSNDALPYARGDHASPTEKTWLTNAMLAADSQAVPIVNRRREIWESRLALSRNLPLTMVMAEMPQRRQSYVLLRGNYNMHGDAVEPGVPEELLVPWPKGAPHNRLGLARWLTRPDHPLTARVVVNRFWAQLFGTGIVKTIADFGAQSEWPSHPELLDWLARDFIDGGWNTKALLRTIVLSATYRQDSDVPAALVERDPENRLLARGPRVRLPAELIRDQALALSGLLKERVGGPSVFPYQPENLYKGVVVGANYPGTSWTQSHGDDLYRRSLYTFWKRTAPYPLMLAFDVPEREFCTARRSRTNTPLQALTLMNETGIVEASRQLATRMVREGGSSDALKATFGFRLATGRVPNEEELQVLVAKLQSFRHEFIGDPKAAAALLKVGESKVDDSIAPSELAATTMVANMILNLDETITKD